MENVVIDKREMELFINKLKTLPKQALPSAVRNTLNSVAFDVKKNTLPRSGEKNFVNRSANFFKANSAVKQASGFNLDTMHSMVGMSDERLKDKSSNYSVKDLEQQEHGGTINKKSFIAMRSARVGNSSNKNVRRTASMQEINNKKITSINRKSANSRKQQFIRAAIYAKTHEDGLVMGHRTAKGGRTLVRIEKLDFNVKSRKMRLKFTPLYNVKKGRKVKVKPTHFMEEAVNVSRKKIPAFFKEASEFQFQKHLKV